VERKLYKLTQSTLIQGNLTYFNTIPDSDVVGVSAISAFVALAVSSFNFATATNASSANKALF
jgi:hypothetical protein